MLRQGLIVTCMILGACATAPNQIHTNNQELAPRPLTKIQSETIDVAASLVQAQRFYAARKFLESHNIYQTLVLHDSSHQDALIGLGNTAIAMGMKETAFLAFSNLDPAALSPEQKVQTIAGLALLSVDRGDRSDHEAHLRHALLFAPDDARLWNALGRHYDQNEQWVESAESYVKALETGTARASVINNLGMSYLMQGRYLEALAKFAQAIDIAPEAEIYDNNRRLTLALQGQYEDAISGLSVARTAMLYNDAGYIAMTRGQTDLARTLITRSIDINPVYDAKAAANLLSLENS